MSQETARAYYVHVVNHWNSMPEAYRRSIHPEQHAKTWLETNVDNLNGNVLSTVAGIIGGAMASALIGIDVDPGSSI